MVLDHIETPPSSAARRSGPPQATRCFVTGESADDSEGASRRPLSRRWGALLRLGLPARLGCVHVLGDVAALQHPEGETLQGSSEMPSKRSVDALVEYLRPQTAACRCVHIAQPVLLARAPLIKQMLSVAWSASAWGGYAVLPTGLPSR